MEPSYASGTSSTPLLGDTIGDNLDRTIERFPDREALVSVPSGPPLHVRAVRRGRRPDRAGVHRGRARARRPRRHLEPELRRVGARPVRAPPRPGSSWSTSTRPTGRRSSSTSCASRAAGCSSPRPRSRRATTSQMVDRRARQPRRPRAGGVPRPRLGGVHRRRRARHAEELRARQAATQFDDPINIQYTSGTTGFPKGATLSHHNILNNGYFVGEGCRYTEEDRVCIPVPYYHCFGMVMGNLACTSARRLHGDPGGAFDAVATLQAVQDERCTSLYGVPTMFIAELEHPEFGEFDLSSLRTGIMAGSPCPIETMRRVVSEMHMEEVTICYGMTETSPVSTQTGADDPLEKRVGTVGPRAPARRGQDRRPRERRDRRPRRARRALHARLQRDARLLGGPGEDRRRDRPRPLDAHRRPRRDGRRGLPQDRRPHQGHGHPRRRERLPARDRGVPVGPPRHRRRAGRRRARRRATARS